ncbi:MAG TPA: hypothetical protein VIU33_09040, partial [Nitrospiria bacterium]
MVSSICSFRCFRSCDTMRLDWKKIVFLFFLPVFTIVSGSKAYATSYRDEFKVSPNLAYQSMLNLAGEKNYLKLNNLLPLTYPIQQHIEGKYFVRPADAVEIAVSEQDSEAVLSSIRIFMAWDMKDLLDEAGRVYRYDPVLAREYIKQARLVYLLLSPHAQKLDFSGDQFINKTLARSLHGIKKQGGDSKEEFKIDPDL